MIQTYLNYCLDVVSDDLTRWCSVCSLITHHCSQSVFYLLAQIHWARTNGITKSFQCQIWARFPFPLPIRFSKESLFGVSRWSHERLFAKVNESAHIDFHNICIYIYILYICIHQATYIFIYNWSLSIYIHIYIYIHVYIIYIYIYTHLYIYIYIT